MKKIIVVNGCKDCPWNQWESNNGNCCVNPNMDIIYFDRDNIEQTETPHPDCKLNDLPTKQDILATLENHNKICKDANINFEPKDAMWFNKGANFIINQITK